MADQMPPNDPLDNRLRSTFAAEHADIERRHLAGGSPGMSARSWKWIPFAVAATLIAIAGFVFIGNRSDDQAVELDVAAQPSDVPTPNGAPVPIDSQGNPVPTPIGIPSPTEPIPYLTGVDMCGDSYNPGPAVVAGRDGANAPAMAEPDASDMVAPSRTLAPGTAVELAGGCTRGATSRGVLQWYEIRAADGEPNDWILSDYLTWQEQPEGVRGEELCGDLRVVPHFVWGVDVNDSDGGLIAHVAAGVDEPATRVLPFDQVVTPTGACALAPNGARWYELFSPTGEADWVNARYLQPTEPACLTGQQSGFILRNGELAYTVVSGDLLQDIAARFDLELAAVIEANPQLDPNLVIAGQVLLIPDAGEPQSVFGPVDGQAIVDGDRIAFNRASDDHYRWYSATGIRLGSTCTALTGADTFEARPCARTSAPVVNPQNDQLYLPVSDGDASSTADHVHDMRTESNDVCTRVVITFGNNANEDGIDGAAATLPPLTVFQGTRFVRISPNGWAMESAFMDPDRIDYPDGIGILALYPGFEFAVELMHREMEPHVRFYENPARIVVDLFPIDSDDTALRGPYGESFILREPIQPDLTGAGIPADNDIVVSGFGRPFEAAGLYRIWSVPDQIDARAFLTDPPEPLIEEFFPTSGWADGWGSFTIELPALAPGSYIAVFGELPPTDEIGFYGTGQLFRVTDAPTEEPGSWPEAVLLPDVQLPPE